MGIVARRPSAVDARDRSAPARVAHAGSGPRVAYFVNCFPNFIETMIYREVAALRGRGLDVVTFSIRRPDPAEVPAEARHFLADTRYILPVGPFRLVARHLAALLRRPVRYWSTLAEVLTGTHSSLRDRVRTLCHFAEAVVVLPEVRALRVDRLHAHWAVGSATCAMVVSRLLDVPFSFTAHAYDVWRDKLLLPEKVHAADRVVTCTDYNRRHLLDAYGAAPDRVTVAYHGLDVARFVPSERAPTAEPVVLSVGRLVEQKGFDRLIRACANLARAGVRFRCDIVGDGPLRAALEALAADLGVADRIRFRGRMHQEELVRAYAEADVFSLVCVPAADDDRDGIPNTILEAMAMELPVVSTRFSGIPEVIDDGRSGFLVERDDEPGLVDRLRRLIEDPALRRRLGREARQRICREFTIDAAAARMEAILRAHPARPAQAVGA